MDKIFDLGLLHGTCISFNGKGVLIIGKSGSGKSSLAIGCLSLGAVLISDDQTELSEHMACIRAQSPVPLRGLIEVVGIGPLPAPVADTCDIALIVNLDARPSARLPHMIYATINKQKIPFYNVKGIPHLPQVIKLLCHQGRH